MPHITVFFSILLILLGVGFYFGTGTESPTALIPAVFGGIFLLLGILAHKENLRKHAMHAAVVLGLIGALAAGYRAVLGLGKLASGGSVEHPAALVSQSLMTFLCLVFVALCVKSFIDARRARKAK